MANQQSDGWRELRTIITAVLDQLMLRTTTSVRVVQAEQVRKNLIEAKRAMDELLGE